MEVFQSRLLCAAMTTVCAAGVAWAHDDDRARARLSSFQEVPALSTGAAATFEAKLSPGTISYELSYRGLESDALQAHIHFGQKSVNGGIVVFLCTNLGNGPAGTQPCPLRAGTISGRITAADVIGPAGQGISAGQFDEFIRAMRSGITYANVHSVTFPGGEVRGQIKVDD
jgi:CHRD domain